MYLTDFVSITVFTMAKGAAYIIILDITAKNPRNFEGEGDINDTVIPATVAIAGYERVRNKSFLWVAVTNLINIIQYENSTIDTNTFTGIRAVFPGVTPA